VVIAMRKIILTILISVVCCALLISSCASPGTTGNPTTATTSTAPTATTSGVNPKTGDLMGNVQAVAWPQTPAQLDQATVREVNKFAAGLLQSSVANKGNAKRKQRCSRFWPVRA
jgi:hypothetical protein